MAFTVVTQSRGDARRLTEWVTYHARLGFEEFHVVLDGLVDDSDEVLAGLDVGARVTVHRRTESGEYMDGLSATERRERNHRWRRENTDLLEAMPFRAQDPLSLRQGLNVGPLLDEVVAGRRGWVAFIDVDEFIHLPRDGSVHELVRRLGRQGATRISFLNFNVDTTGHDPRRPVLEQHRYRWSREDLLAHPVQAWAQRVKTLARFDVATPYRGVHKLTRGPRVVPDPQDARLLHFRTPMEPLEPLVPYSVEDPITMPAPTPAGSTSRPPARRRWFARRPV